ncbi:hypothetical protein SADUNF_Sadunf16G0131300 [Salix dunnii]|uniref:Uncharacterized protein n=1 Tax=Salix dunnii TaxID=1413687 RepID=A0A835J8G5_9ROSI|nr:hypothetical protein SADUNF_Sadunf16G0131300 [Salix dunnii]
MAASNTTTEDQRKTISPYNITSLDNQGFIITKDIEDKYLGSRPISKAQQSVLDSASRRTKEVDCTGKR